MSDQKKDEFEIDEEIIEVEDENGNIRELIIAETFELKEKVYAVLIDRNQPDGDATIVVYEEDGEELNLYDIEDDQEWSEVLKAYEALAQTKD